VPVEIEIHQEPMAALADYSSISIAFRADRILDVHESERPAGGWSLSERALDAPYIKNYDALDGGPTRWPHRFNLSNWRLFIARFEGKPAGGIVLAYESPDLDLLDGRNDLALIWDLRVEPEFRRQGVGCALYREAEKWVRERNYREVKVETQNINLAACRFYLCNGFKLRAVRPFAYEGLPGEIQLLWYKDLLSETV
jgi:ribosomal protein S18 acetylase RimI-like enzyme